MRKIGAYSIYDEAASVLRFDDGKGSSFYLLEGETAAVLVDTGMADEPLRPVIERLTDKPVTVVITHAHGDHMCHADEFDHCYIDTRDLAILPSALQRLGIRRSIDTGRFTGFQGGDTLRFGDVTLLVLDAGGHSPGSVVFYEPDRGLLFTGDAVGSGAGVWMQLAGCLPLTQYRANLRKLLAFLDTLPKQPQIFSGHADQRYFKKGSDNPVCRDLISDMITLSTLILEHREARTDGAPFLVREKSPVYVSEYGRASIVYSEDVIA